MMQVWIVFALAVALEVIGTSAMQASRQFT